MNATLLNKQARRFEATSGAPWMSVKYMLAGSARYRVDRSEYEVGQGRCLILNEGSPYTITINSPDVVESLVVFFQPDHVASVIGSLTRTDENLLDEPDAIDSDFRFQESIYLVDHDFTKALTAIRRQNPGGSGKAILTGEAVDTLFKVCVFSQRAITRHLQRLDAIRPSTRRELQRRLAIARDYLLSNYSAKLSLEQVARQCDLSPYHLSRQFKAVYGRSPMNFLGEFRLRRAVELLCSTSRSVLDICLEVGFESPTTLGARIKTLTGFSPRELRRK